VKFRVALFKRYLRLADLEDDKIDDSPSSMTPEESDRLIELTISWDDAEKWSRRSRSSRSSIGWR
jgi:hypothetical protein